MKKSILFLFMVLVLFSRGAWCGTFGVEEKIALENSISKKIEDITVKILGDRNIVVIVNIEQNPIIEQEVKRVGSTKRINDKDLLSENKGNYLPGIPIDEEIMPKRDESFSQTIKLPQFIKSISITIIVRDTISDELVENVKKYLSEILNLNISRGDTLVIKKMFFAIDENEKASFLKNTLITQAALILGIFLLALFVFGPLRNFFGKLVNAIESFKVHSDMRILNQSTTTPKINVNESPAAVQPEGSLAVAADKPRLNGKHFSFINKDNINNLLYLIKNEDPENIAIVLTYLSKEFSSMVVNGLPEQQKTEIVRRMAIIKQYDGNVIKSIEDKFKERIDYLLGGPQAVADLINTYDLQVRERILADIAKDDAAIVSEIRKIMVTFDDLCKLTKEQFYEVYKIVGTRVLSMALKGASETVHDYVKQNLTQGAQDMLKQEMDLIPAGTSVDRTDQARKDVIKAMQTLEKQGIIKIPRNPI
jgi:flagellar motor switch protein FliG